jgi:tRNA uridine 5-carboxymethylaminomethyl modification enzyme
MFTSRAEHRLLLRHDNADLRLTELGAAAGLVDSERQAKTNERARTLAEAKLYAEQNRLEGIPLSRWLRRPENHPGNLPQDLRGRFSSEIWEALEIDFKYEGYVIRQNLAVEKLRKSETRRLPADLDYEIVNGLRAETRQKLSKVRPETLGQASRISGITPSDIALLAIWVRKREPESLNETGHDYPAV